MLLPMEDDGSVSGTEGSSGRVLLSYSVEEGPGPTEQGVLLITVQTEVHVAAYTTATKLNW